MKKSIQALFTITAITAGSFLWSCEKAIFDYEGDCSIRYRLPMTYKMNSLDADAFPSQVNSVTLYVYDQQGKQVLRRTVGNEALSQTDYAIEISGDELKPGNYRMLVWGTGEAEGKDPVSFSMGGGQNSPITDLDATLPLSGSEGNLYSDRDITPLFYGYKEIELPDGYGDIPLPTIDLIKDTNIFTIIMENVEGFPIAEDALTVRIETDKNELTWQNLPSGNLAFEYRPWHIQEINSQRPQETRDGEGNGSGEGGDDGNNDPLITGFTGLLTELTTGRMMADSKPMLVVHRTWDDKDILRLDLVNLICLVRGNFGNWSEQEYLDRIDRYSLTFFIDADLNWYMAGGINILGWKVVPPQDMEL